jgi:hypothetical protein
MVDDGMVYGVYLSLLKMLDRSAIVFSWKIDAKSFGCWQQVDSFRKVGPIMSANSRQLTASDME